MSVEVAYGGSEQGRYFLVDQRPVWAAVLESVADWACKRTRGRACHRVCGPTIRLTDRHTSSFRIPADETVIEQYAAWRGWDTPWWVDDEETS